MASRQSIACRSRPLKSVTISPWHQVLAAVPRQRRRGKTACTCCGLPWAPSGSRGALQGCSAFFCQVGEVEGRGGFRPPSPPPCRPVERPREAATAEANLALVLGVDTDLGGSGRVQALEDIGDKAASLQRSAPLGLFAGVVRERAVVARHHDDAWVKRSVVTDQQRV